MLYRLPEINDPFSASDQVSEYLNALLYGGKCLGYSKVTITGAAPKTFADAIGLGAIGNGIPPAAKMAVCVLEASNNEANAPRVCRFNMSVEPPTINEGMPVGDNGSFEVNGTDNIADFEIIGITAANTHILRVMWFGAKTQ